MELHHFWHREKKPLQAIQNLQYIPGTQPVSIEVWAFWSV